MQNTFDTFLDAAKEVDTCTSKVMIGVTGQIISVLVNIDSPADAVVIISALNKLSAQLSEDLYQFVHEFDKPEHEFDEPEHKLDDSREPNELVH